jgi:hypothetical protein
MSTITASGAQAVSKRRERTRIALEWGGFAAAAILIVFGVVAIVMGFNGRSTVADSLKQEQIVGSSDMTPAQIKKDAVAAGLDVNSISMPTVNIANKAIDSGTRARAFASYMRIHTLEATKGYTYAQMGRYVAKPGAPVEAGTQPGTTSNTQYALMDKATGQPVANGLRDLWVTETALTTALNTSYMADRLGLFGIVVGVALLLTGIGFAVLSFAALHRKKTAAI